MNAIANQRVSEVLASALKAERNAINARFAEYRAGGHPVDGEQFLEHLATVIDPLVCQVAELFPERIRTVVTELCGVSLELLSNSLLGPSAKFSAVSDVWHKLLPAIPRLVARQPGHVAGCLCNAVYNMSTQSGTLPDDWIDRLAAVSGKCDDTATLLDCGRVLAWQAGMAQYREAAIVSLQRLSEPVTRQLLGLDDDLAPNEIASVIKQLESNPWSTAEAELAGGSGAKSIRLVRTVGAFRGFGGPFLAPPTVRCANDQLFVSDGHGDWLLLADAYGSLLARTKLPADNSKSGKESPAIDAQGTVSWGSHTASFPHLSSSSSCAYDGTTLAVTLSTSHHVFLLAIS